jgi:hypothetical protein
LMTLKKKWKSYLKGIIRRGAEENTQADRGEI